MVTVHPPGDTVALLRVWPDGQVGGEHEPLDASGIHRSQHTIGPCGGDGQAMKRPRVAVAIDDRE